jgi:hypothetical protein
MDDYQLEGPKPARMYEVILPKKLGYFGKVQEVLEDLFREDAIRAIPFVRETIAEGRRRDPAFDEEAWIRTLGRASRGYSIYEMDGRYLAPQGPIDERVLVIRFIFHNPRRPGRPSGRLPGRLAGGGQSPGRPPLRRGARRRGGDLVPGIHPSPAGDLAQECRRRPGRGGQRVSISTIERYAAGGPLLVYAAAGLTPEQETARPGPGRWSVAELVAHLLDSDLVYAERMKRVLAEDRPTLMAFDENAWIDRLGAQDDARGGGDQPLRRPPAVDDADPAALLGGRLRPRGRALGGRPAEPGRDRRADRPPRRPPPEVPLRKRANLGVALYPRYTDA